MNAEDLDAIEARAAAATPGPWLPLSCDHIAGEAYEDYDIPDEGVWWLSGLEWIDIEDEGLYFYLANAVFIAHARTDVPALIARVRELEAELAERERAS